MIQVYDMQKAYKARFKCDQQQENSIGHTHIIRTTMVKIGWNAHPKTIKISILYALMLSLLHSSIFYPPPPPFQC